MLYCVRCAKLCPTSVVILIQRHRERKKIKKISMTTLVAHSLAQPRECSLVPHRAVGTGGVGTTCPPDFDKLDFPTSS